MSDDDSVPHMPSLATSPSVLEAGERRRTHTTVACSPCRVARKKCNGREPCESCSRRGIECVYNNESDGRTKESRKRKVESLQNDSELLHDLIDMIRTKPDDEVARVLSLIRSSDTTDEIRRSINEQSVSADHTASSDYGAEWDESTGKMTGEARRNSVSKPNHALNSTATNDRRKMLDISQLIEHEPSEGSAMV